MVAIIKFIVTGASGHIGNNIIRELVLKGERVIALVRRENDEALNFLDIEKVIGDVRDIDILKDIIDENTIVIHSAGIIGFSEKNKEELDDVNIKATINLAKTCIEKKAKKFVYIASVDGIYREEDGLIIEPFQFYPDRIESLYGKTKAVASKYILEQIENGNLNGVILYPSAVIGPNDFKISNTGEIILNCIKGKLMVRIKGGYNFIDVRDVAKATIEAATNETESSYLITGENVSIDELVAIIYEKLEKKHLPLKVPLWLANAGLFFVEKYNNIFSKDTPYNRQTLRYLGSNHNYINEKAINDLDLEVRDIKDSVSDTIDWFIANKL